VLRVHIYMRRERSLADLSDMNVLRARAAAVVSPHPPPSTLRRPWRASVAVSSHA